MKRYLSFDVHKDFIVIAGIDAKQNVVFVCRTHPP